MAGRAVGLAAWLALALAASAMASQISLVSRAEPTLPNDAAGGNTPRLSADGRYAIFLSQRPNLLPGMVDANSGNDVFLRDRTTGTIVLVSRSVSSPITTANGSSEAPSLSADGRYVAFTSEATDLVAGQTDTNGDPDVFLFDRTTGAVTLVSHAASSLNTTANAGGDEPVLSADGTALAFISRSTDLVSGYTGPFLVPADQVVLYDRATGVNRLVSHKAATPTSGSDSGGDSPALSADGRFVVYQGYKPDLVAGASSWGGPNIVLYDRTTDANVLVSHASASSTVAGNGNSENGRISADGAWVAFDSNATDLVAGVSGSNSRDVFLWSRQTGAVILVSHAAGLSLTESNGASNPLSLSADGRFVAFDSGARNLLAGPPEADADADADIFLYDRQTGTSALVSHGTGGPDAHVIGDSRVAGISSGGGHVAFVSLATDLAAGLRDLNYLDDAFAWNRATGAIDLLSKTALPSATASSRTLLLSPPSRPTAQISADGRWVVFASQAANLVPGQLETASGETTDVFLHDRLAGTTVLVSHKAGASPGTVASGDSTSPVISADGRWVAFESSAPDLVPGQSGAGRYNAFLFDRDSGQMTLVSHVPGSATTGGNDDSAAPSLNADGSRITFGSRASDLGFTDTNGLVDVFLADRATGEVTLVSHVAGEPTTTAAGDSVDARLSADGAFVVFQSWAGDLVAGQTDPAGALNVFLYDVEANTSSLVSHVPASLTTTANGSTARDLTLSDDAGFIAFTSSSTDQVTGQGENVATDLDRDVFLQERATGITRVVSHVPGGTTPSGSFAAELYGLSADGRFVVFDDFSTGLVWGPGEPQEPSVFLYDRETGENVLVSHAMASPTQPASPSSYRPVLSARSAGSSTGRTGSSLWR